MYSVEDLLISHGYKVSSSSNNNNAPPSRSPSSHSQPPPTRSNSRCEITDKRTGHGAVNGYKDCVHGGVRQTSSKGDFNDKQGRDGKQRTEEEDNGNLGDGHSPGDTVTNDRGLHDGHREMHSQPSLSHWRRQGQDFSMFLDYTDFREPHGKALGVPPKAEGMQRRPESALSAEEHRRERQRRADSARARERELALYQWRMAAERKYQSLGTEEWRPAVGLGRHVSESEAEKCAQEQRRPRTAEGVVPPRTKAKSQSLPRMPVPSGSVQYFNISSSGQDPCGTYRINGHQSRGPHGRNISESEIRERRADISRLGVQSAPPSKPRFSRPLRPPSYEVHQQMRGSSEMLSGDFLPHSRDRTPLPFSRQDYFAQDSGGSSTDPPGYIPPPSYRRQPTVRPGHRTYASSMCNYQFKGDLFMQGPAMAEVQEWFMRQTGMAWPDHYRDGRRSMPCRRQAYPAYSEDRMGNVQYIPFDDPRVRHISGEGMDGNSLTDADKIRNIRKEVPFTSSERSSLDNAILFSGKMPCSTERRKNNISDCVNEVIMSKEVTGEVNTMKPVTDENLNRYTANHDLSNTVQLSSSQPRSSSEQSFCETVTQVKTFEALTAAENKKNKKKIKETMFCLVSVPINIMTNKDTVDPNNNDKVPSSALAPCENSVTQPCSKDLSKNAKSNEQLITAVSSTTVKNSKRAPIRKDIIDVWSLQASADKELCYAGSWPGEQYKNQETQTGSPEISKNTHVQTPYTMVTYNPSSSDATYSQLSKEGSSNQRYHPNVQKHFNPSSTSTFSQTRPGRSTSIKSPVSVPTASTPSSPSHQSILNKGPPDGQEVFGQFLLKPVNRRPWDAIGELESFNKEIQDHNMKQQSAGKSVEDLNEALKNILEVSNTTATFVRPMSAPQKVRRNRHGIERSPEPQLKNGNLNIRSDFENRGLTSKDFRDVRSVYSRPIEGFMNPNISQRQELAILEDKDSLNYDILHSIHDDLRLSRLDIPVAKESLLKDVGLTVYTAIPDTVTVGSPTGLSPESPMLTSPSDNSETCDVLQITSSDSGGDQSINSPDFNLGHQSLRTQTAFNEKPYQMMFDGDSKIVARSQRSSRVHSVRSQHLRFKANNADDDLDDDLYSDYLSWSNEKTVADEHLEALLSQEKANSMPSEDLSNLYKIQSAQGIPVHETIEERAARILGITVSVEALVINQDDGKQGEESDAAAYQGSTVMQNEEAQHVISETTQVIESVEAYEQIKENRKGDEVIANSHTVGMSMEIPEFPPTNLRLSIPMTEDEDLVLSVCKGEKKVTLVADISEEPVDRLIVPHPSSVHRNEETSAQHINPEVEDKSMSCTNSFRKEVFNTRESEEMEKQRNEKRFQQDKVLDEREQSVENDRTATEWETMVEQRIDSDNDRMRENEKTEHKEDEIEDRTEQLTCSVPIPQPRNGTVAKREITLPDSCSMTSDSVDEDDVQSVSDTYDPSRVERV